MITLNIPDIDELYTWVTEILSLCQCAEDAAAAVHAAHVETTLSIANGTTQALQMTLNDMMK